MSISIVLLMNLKLISMHNEGSVGNILNVKTHLVYERHHEVQLQNLQDWLYLRKCCSVATCHPLEITVKKQCTLKLFFQ